MGHVNDIVTMGQSSERHVIVCLCPLVFIYIISPKKKNPKNTTGSQVEMAPIR